MKVDFTGRGVDVTPRIKSFTESKLERLRKHLDEVQSLAVILSAQKYRQQIEIRVQTKKRVFVGSEESNDMFHAIDSAIDKLESQLSKHKAKMVAKKRNTTETIRDAAVFDVQVAATEAAPAQEVQVIRTDNAMVKPMDLEEAVDELVKLEHDFLVFRNSETDDFNVVYRRSDGHVGYFAPEG
jgi:putative sigma-54 modulation protein